MDDLASERARLLLKAKETSTVDLPPLVENKSRVLVAKLLTKRRVNLEARTRTLRSMWRFAQNFEVRDLGSNTVLLIFEDEIDAQKILVQGPWTFNKYLIGLYKPKGDKSNDVMFDHVSFWVQFHKLPLRRMKLLKLSARHWESLNMLIPQPLENAEDAIFEPESNWI